MLNSQYTKEEIERIRFMFTNTVEINENDISILPWFDDSIKDINTLTDEDVITKYDSFCEKLDSDFKALDSTQLYDFFEDEKVIVGDDIKGIKNVQE